MKTLAIAILVILCSAYLSFMHLGNASFWDDESHVGIIAKNFLASGQLTGWDGRNLLGYKNGALLDQHLRTINPPLQHLTATASFWVFGPSTWAGRFPFVLAGLASLVLFARLLRHDYGSETYIWLYALSLLAFSVVFFLNIRQCRYYALTLLFSLLTFYAYQRCLRTQRLCYFALLAVAAVLLFYSNYLLGTAFLLALGAVHMVFHGRAFGLKAWQKLTAAVVFFILATVPYAIYFQIWERPDLPVLDRWFVYRPQLLWWNVRELNLLGCLPVVMAAGLLAILLRYRQAQPVVHTAWQWLTLGLGYVFFLALLSPQSPQVTTMAEVRYLLPAAPFLAGLGGVCLWFVHQQSRLVAVIVFAMTTTNNVLALAPLTQPFRWLLPAYIAEVHSDYPTSARAVVSFLRKHAAQDDLVVAYPAYENYPIMFYAGDHIRLCCQLTDRTRLSPKTLASLDAPLQADQHVPDWFVAYGNHPAVWQSLGYFSRQSQSNGQDTPLRYQLVEILDVYWAATQRPELPWHSFGPKTDFDRRAEAVYVFRRSGYDKNDREVFTTDF